MRSFVHPIIVFETPWNSSTMDSYREFHNIKDLKKFLSTYNFSEQSRIYNYGCIFPEFRLGTKYEFFKNGYDFRSTIKWGPHFIAGRNVRIEGKRLFVNAPMDTVFSCADDVDVLRKWQWIEFHPKMFDAVIDLQRMRQLWPCCENSRSELSKFLTRMSREKLSVQVR